ncbi:MAG: TrbI/VirB10 family protein [Deltaproteobacteria bacterium]|nr:TrbI/VirB10 family protein [Deltaproteobacteria bacterium]
MSEEAPKVELGHDYGEKLQWGLGLLYFVDGKKWTVRVKLLFVLAFALAGAVAFFQCLGPQKILRRKSQITVPSESPQAVIELQSNKVSSKKSKQKVAGIQTFYGPQLLARPIDLKKIPPGSMLRANLLSGGSNGLVTAQVKEALTVNGDVFIDTGSTLLGQGSSTEERLFVSFNQVVFKDGSFGQIQAQACDESDKIVGLKGSKLGNKGINIAGSIGLGFLGGFSEGLQDTRGEQGATVRPPSLKNALLNATATTALEQSQNLMSDLKNRQPLIEVPANTDICIIFGGGL